MTLGTTTGPVLLGGLQIEQLSYNIGSSASLHGIHTDFRDVEADMIV